MFEKFPKLFSQGRMLVWDLRQDLRGVEPARRQVYVKSFLDAVTQQRLREIPAASHVTTELPEFQLGQAAARACDDPSEKLKIVGVTGTNGKSTTVALLGQMLSNSSETPIVVIGTLGIQIFKAGICETTIETGFTTPEAPSLQHFLSACVDKGWKEVVMEASSQGWSLGRLAGLRFETLGFTNLTQDHLDFHGTMAAYGNAKAEIFRRALRGNGALHAGAGGESAKFVAELSRELGPRAKVLDHHQEFLERRSTLDGHHFLFAGLDYDLPLVGEHNLENLRVAFELYRELRGSYPVPASVKALRPARGRLELAGGGARPYVYVDYAHTADALEKSLLALKELKRPEQKLWVVFGCGGDRDPSKRPLMGAVAAALADEVVVTSDNPRTENPAAILQQVVAGLGRSARLVEVDRRLAIRESLRSMGADDVLLIAGKGHEEYQILGTQKVPFSDFQEVRQVLNQNFTT